MVFRLAQISDTHLSPRHPVFDRNFAAVAERLRADRPDLVIHTGDISAAMRADAGAVADLDIGADDSEGADLDAAALEGKSVDVIGTFSYSSATPKKWLVVPVKLEVVS